MIKTLEKADVMDDSEDMVEAPETDIDWEEYLKSLNEDQVDVAEEILGKTKTSIDQSIQLLEDAKKIGENTLDKLESQGEQLKHVDKQLNEIRRDNHENKRRLRVVRSAFGSLFNRIFSCKCLQPQDDEWTQPEPFDPRPRPSTSTSTSTTTPATQGSTPLYDMYKETELGLDRVQELTLDLNWLAKSMNKVINSQNENLDRIYAKADLALQEMRELTRSTRETL